MKIAVTSTGPTLEYYVGTQVSHCPYLLIIDSDTMRYEAMQNPIISLKGPAAKKLFAQLLSQSCVETILTGNCGSRILEFMGNAEVAVVSGISGSVRSAVDRFRYRNYSMVS